MLRVFHSSPLECSSKVLNAFESRLLDLFIYIVTLQSERPVPLEVGEVICGKVSPLASKLVEAPLRRGLVLGPTFLVKAERPEVIDIVDKSFVLFGISIHIPPGLFFEVVELVFLNVLPNAADLFHDVQGGNVWVISHHLGPCLYFYVWISKQLG